MEAPNQEIIQRLQSKVESKAEFDFDHLHTSRPLYAMLSYEDIGQLYRIATSVRYAGNPVKRFNAIDEIMHKRGFIKLSSGTNRIAYSCLEDPTIVVKIAADKTALNDNSREFQNQMLLKPFCTKCFEVSCNGVAGLFERVRPIQSREEYETCAEQVFQMLDMLTKRYILADVGSHYFMNIGIRENFGPVLLDFPYCYDIGSADLICRKPDPTSLAGICGGLIDYDEGYNNLRCNKCGAIYKAVDIAKYISQNIIRRDNMYNEEDFDFGVSIVRTTTNATNEKKTEEVTTKPVDKTDEIFGKPADVIKATIKEDTTPTKLITVDFSKVEEKPANTNDFGVSIVRNKVVKKINEQAKSKDHVEVKKYKENNYTNHVERKEEMKSDTRALMSFLNTEPFEFQYYEAAKDILTVKSKNKFGQKVIIVHIDGKSLKEKQRFTLQAAGVDPSIVTELETAKADILKVEDENASLKNGIKEFQTLVKTYEAKIAELNAVINSTEDNGDVEAQMNTIKKKLDESENERDAFESQVIELNNQLAELNEKYAKLVDENKDYKEKYEKLKHELEENISEPVSDDSVSRDVMIDSEYSPTVPVGTEADENDPETYEDQFSMSPLQGSIYTISQLISLGYVVPNELKGVKKVIALEVLNNDGSFVSDGDGNIVVITKVNGEDVSALSVEKKK